MTQKNPNKEKNSPLKPRNYREPGETPGMREGKAPSGEDLEKVNTKEKEVQGYKGPEPTRYGDWEQNGRCTDF